MILMLRVLVFATLVFVIPPPADAQPLSVLHIKVALVNAGQQLTPVPRHALLISANPATAAPRRVVTTLDGTVDVRLRPGNYTVESDVPITFLGRSYHWTQTLDVAAGGDTTLELTAGNAEVEQVGSPIASAAPSEGDPSAILMQWQDSVVALWTSITRASGFVVDARGLIATSRRAIGTATTVEVQLTPEVKVAGRVMVADPLRDVAIIRIDPQALASIRSVPLECALPSKPALVDGQMIFTIGWPLREQKGITSGTVSREVSQDLVSDFSVARGSAGSPVFAASGGLVGITSAVDETDEGKRRDFRVVGIDKACEVVAAAASKIAAGDLPESTLLPVEPGRTFPVDALKRVVQRRAGSLSPYQISSADFEIAFITPVQLFGEQYQSEQANRRGGSARKTGAEQVLIRPLMDFINWSDYVADFPPVLLVRVTPKLVERLWTTVARGAAQTQGVALPPIKHFKSGFSRMQAFCGAAEITPIHPFRLEHPVPGNDAIYEGLYAFDPGALGPECESVKLVLYSEKEPDKADTRVVDPKVVQQIWQDFTPYRETK